MNDEDEMFDVSDEDREKWMMVDACGAAIELAPDTLQRWGVAAQRAKCLEEMKELKDAIKNEAAYHAVEYERAVIDECADVLIMAMSCASTIGAMNWREQLADRIQFKVARTRDRMKK